MSPSSGTGVSPLTASGTGCIGASAGVSIRIDDPSGQPISGDGTSARADGSWVLPFTIGGNVAPGTYTIHADCRIQAQVLFLYPPRTFTVTA